MKAVISVIFSLSAIGLTLSCSREFFSAAIEPQLYSSGCIKGSICNINYKIDNRSEYRASAISCGHGIEAYEYLVKKNGYYFVSCSKQFDITKFKPDTIFVYNDTEISYIKADDGCRLKREWPSGFCIFHYFKEEMNFDNNIKKLKSVELY